VEHGRGDPFWDREVELGDEAVEDLACAARVHPPPAVEAEQWAVSFPATPFDLTGEELADTRAVRDEAALSELASANDEQLSVLVDVADQQAARLAGA
jgi:hypothetical protein